MATGRSCTLLLALFCGTRTNPESKLLLCKGINYQEALTCLTLNGNGVLLESTYYLVESRDLCYGGYGTALKKD